MIAYISTTLELSRTTALLAVSVAAAVSLVTIPFYGGLSDRVGRRKVYAFGAATFGLFAIPSFLLVNTANTLVIFVALIVAFGVFYPVMYGPIAAFWAEVFATRVRYTGVLFVYQFSGIFASGLTPLIATALLGAAGGEPWLVGGYMMLVAAISLASVFALQETYRKDILPTGAPQGPAPEPGVAG